MTALCPPLLLPDADAMARFAQRLAPHLGPGDVLLLEGPIGAGKTHFARALIQSLLAAPEDVPSPTFTLVQVYDGPGFEIWHSDLYRLSHPDDALELGLLEAFQTALSLVEWPERLGEDRPDSALTLRIFVLSDDARRLELFGDAVRWAERLKEVCDV